MSQIFSTQITDFSLFVIANLVNILLTGIFLFRVKGYEKVEYFLGLIMVAFALPVSIIVIYNISMRREWWTIVLPVILIIYLIIELLFDYILKLNWRETSLLWPYLVVFYLALLSMIGYSFSIGESHGFITLTTYFISLFATWYAHRK